MPDYLNLNKLLKESCREASEEFHASTKQVDRIQKEKLLKIIFNSCETDFGRKHNFDKIRSVDDFRLAVPITNYEHYEDYVVQIADGKKKVLTKDEVLMLEPTSGSTSPSKFIPYTESLKREFQKGIFPWLYDLLQNKTNIGNGSFYWSITPAMHRQEKTSGGIPIGFGDDGVYFTDKQKSIISQLSAVPFDVAQIQDIDKFKEKTLEHMIGNRDLSFISVWNPTFLSLLLRPLPDLSKSLIKDIKDKKRRGELEIALGGTESNLYERIWPNLSLISSWADGNASNYIAGLKELFPNAEIQGKGLIATEGFISFPLVDYEGAALSVNSHFFEFRDIQNPNDVRLAHEVEKERQYELILTTSGGFYRYNLEDIVQIVGFKDQCPLLKFIGRNNNVSDLFGEKLNEYHVSSVIKETLQKYEITPSFFMIAPEKLERDETFYTLFIESPNGNATHEMGNYLDSKLQENYHYRYCRKLGQLEATRIFLIDNNGGKTASDIYLEEGRARGKKIGNVKPAALSSHMGWTSKFNGRFI
ncbi:MAG: GH3 auxin-responsive promoter family protein [Nanoarchaeota archaeon]|nr:GH3 auxin-responsive promoter family protein [Nanoarchaeota archaeon]